MNHKEQLKDILSRPNPNDPNEPPSQWVDEACEAEYWLDKKKPIQPKFCQTCGEPLHREWSDPLGEHITVHPTVKDFLTCMALKRIVGGPKP